MKKLLSLLITFALTLALPCRAQYAGQAETINSQGFPAWIQQDVFPSIGAHPTRSVGAAIIASNAGTSFAAFGAYFSSFTLSANGSGGTFTNASSSTTGNWVKFTTGAVSGDYATGVAVTEALWQQYPRYVCTITTGASISNFRIQCGMNNSPTTYITSDSPAASSQSVMVTYAPGTDGTAFWRTYVAANGQTSRFTTTYPIAANTEYTIGIDATNLTSILFYINGTLVNTSTSGANPTTGINGCDPFVGVCTTTSSSSTLLVKNVYMDSL